MTLSDSISSTSFISKDGTSGLFSTCEIEFISENEMITIIPSSKLPKIKLIDNEYGPLRPLIKVNVPLWLGLAFKRGNRCNIQPPDWLDLDYLNSKLSEEELNENQLTDLPFHYLETSHLILTSAADDVPKSEQIKSVLKDIRIIRQRKINKFIRNMDHYLLQIQNISLMELQEIGPFFKSSFNELRKMNPEDVDLNDEDQVMTKREEVLEEEAHVPMKY